jgi:polar amino acid transport system substrate-binding protein
MNYSTPPHQCSGKSCHFKIISVILLNLYWQRYLNLIKVIRVAVAEVNTTEVVIYSVNWQSLILAGFVSSVVILPFKTVAELEHNVTEPKLTLRFCYEDKQLLPYYAGDNNLIPTKPGATIEHLQAASEKAGIALQLFRMPWLRCLHYLEENKVDALVAAYSAERAHYTYYPKDAAGQPDTDRAINTNALCLAHRFDNDLPRKLSTPSEPLAISRPYGYQPLPLPEHALLIGAHSPEQALELVVSRRVDATTVTCEINGITGNRQEIKTLPLKILQPPVYFSVGYLMLSKQFYQQHPAIAEQLWQALPQTLDHQRYIDYLAYPLGF